MWCAPGQRDSFRKGAPIGHDGGGRDGPALSRFRDRPAYACGEPEIVSIDDESAHEGKSRKRVFFL